MLAVFGTACPNFLAAGETPSVHAVMPFLGAPASNSQPEDVTENRLGPSGARTSSGGEPSGHGAAPWAMSHRPMASLRSSALCVSGFQNDLVSSTPTRSPSGNSSSMVSQPGTK
jgi:hypothetical protein